MTKISLTLNKLSCERDERVLFEGLDAELCGGDVVQVAGPNGAGKTTLLKGLAGIASNFAGEILWCGKPRGGYAFYSSLLYFGHTPGVKSSLTAVENLAWYFGLNGVKSAAVSANGGEQRPSRQSLSAALASVGLSGYEDVPCHQMSAGQQRRIALARLYLSEAPLWILDEPFTAIDKKGVASLEATIQAHADRGGLIILTTHQAMALDQVRILDLADYFPKRRSSQCA